MIEIRIHSNAPLVAKRLEDLGAKIPKISKGRIYGRVQAMIKRITKYPLPWRGRLPRGWFKSDRQRRYVMMLVREGKVPYQRGGSYESDWSVEANRDGYTLRSTGEKARWVSGDEIGLQAKIHQGRWAVAIDVVKEEIEKLPDEIITEIHAEAVRIGL